MQVDVRTRAATFEPLFRRTSHCDFTYLYMERRTGDTYARETIANLPEAKPLNEAQIRDRCNKIKKNYVEYVERIMERNGDEYEMQNQGPLLFDLNEDEYEQIIHGIASEKRVRQEMVLHNLGSITHIFHPMTLAEISEQHDNEPIVANEENCIEMKVLAEVMDEHRAALGSYECALVGNICMMLANEIEAELGYGVDM